MSDVVSLDKTVVGWLVAAGGSFILFLLGLGVKDVSDRLNEVPDIKEGLGELRSKHERTVAELNGEISRLETEIKHLQREVERLHVAIDR